MSVKLHPKRRRILGVHAWAKWYHDAVAIRVYHDALGRAYYALSYREVQLDVCMRAPLD